MAQAEFLQPDRIAQKHDHQCRGGPLQTHPNGDALGRETGGDRLFTCQSGMFGGSAEHPGHHRRDHGDKSGDGHHRQVIEFHAGGEGVELAHEESASRCPRPARRSGAYSRRRRHRSATLPRDPAGPARSAAAPEVSLGRHRPCRPRREPEESRDKSARLIRASETLAQRAMPAANTGMAARPCKPGASPGRAPSIQATA